MSDETPTLAPKETKGSANATEHAENTEKASGQADHGGADETALEKAEAAERGGHGTDEDGQR